MLGTESLTPWRKCSPRLSVTAFSQRPQLPSYLDWMRRATTQTSGSSFTTLFILYLTKVLNEEAYNKFVSKETTVECNDGHGVAFGKPTWDFEYPVSSFFVTKGKRIGCSISLISPGDLVYAPLGCVHPLILRPDGDRFRIRGSCFVSGIMHGEAQDTPRTVVEIFWHGCANRGGRKGRGGRSVSLYAVGSKSYVLYRLGLSSLLKSVVCCWHATRQSVKCDGLPYLYRGEGHGYR